MNSLEVRLPNWSGSIIDLDSQGWKTLLLLWLGDVNTSRAYVGSGWNWSLGILGYFCPMNPQDSLYVVLLLLYHFHSIGKIVP